MALFRRPAPAQAEPEPPAPASINLANVPSTSLYLEMRGRGFEIFPEGVFGQTVSRLEARAEKAERIVAAVERECPELRDLIYRLADIAGEFPKVVEEIGELRGENMELRDRARLSEGDAERLAHVMVGREIDALERGTNDNED